MGLEGILASGCNEMPRLLFGFLSIVEDVDRGAKFIWLDREGAVMVLTHICDRESTINKDEFMKYSMNCYFDHTRAKKFLLHYDEEFLVVELHSAVLDIVAKHERHHHVISNDIKNFVGLVRRRNIGKKCEKCAAGVIVQMDGVDPPYANRLVYGVDVSDAVAGAFANMGVKDLNVKTVVEEAYASINLKDLYVRNAVAGAFASMGVEDVDVCCVKLVRLLHPLV